MFIERCGAGCGWQAVAQALFPVLNTLFPSSITLLQAHSAYSCCSVLHAASEAVQLRSVAEC